MLSAAVSGLSGSPAPDGPAATAFRAEQTGGDRTRTKQTNTQDVIEVNQATEIVEPCLPSPAKLPIRPRATTLPHSLMLSDGLVAPQQNGMLDFHLGSLASIAPHSLGPP